MAGLSNYLQDAFNIAVDMATAPARIIAHTYQTRRSNSDEILIPALRTANLYVQTQAPTIVCAALVVGNKWFGIGDEKMFIPFAAATVLNFVVGTASAEDVKGKIFGKSQIEAFRYTSFPRFKAERTARLG